MLVLCFTFYLEFIRVNGVSLLFLLTLFLVTLNHFYDYKSDTLLYLESIKNKY